MTPKEKAEELYDKVRPFMVDELEYSADNDAKNCVVILVEEIIEAIKSLLERQELQMDFDYWNNVLNELKKM